MPRVKEIEAALAQLAPVELAESWDNVGALVDCGSDVTSVLVALDITDEVVMEAEQMGCQLIVAHHPVIFTPIKSLARSDTVFRMIKKNISGVCMHTNLDAAAGGVNDVLAGLFGLAGVRPFAGMGRVGTLAAPVEMHSLAQHCKTLLGAPVRYVDAGRPVQTVAVLGGAGGDFLSAAAQAGADCLVTGEASHHQAIDSRHMGLSLVAAGHFETEWPVTGALADFLTHRFEGLRVVVSRRNKSPFAYL